LDEQGPDPDEGKEAADLRHRSARDRHAHQAGEGQGSEPRRRHRRRPPLPRASALLELPRYSSVPDQGCPTAPCTCAFVGVSRFSPPGGVAAGVSPSATSFAPPNRLLSLPRRLTAGRGTA